MVTVVKTTVVLCFLVTRCMLLGSVRRRASVSMTEDNMVVEQNGYSTEDQVNYQLELWVNFTQARRRHFSYIV